MLLEKEHVVMLQFKLCSYGNYYVDKNGRIGQPHMKSSLLCSVVVDWSFTTSCEEGFTIFLLFSRSRYRVECIVGRFR